MTQAVKDKALNLVGQGYIYGARGQTCSLAFRQQQAKQYPDQADKILGTGAKWDGMPVWDCAQLTRECAKAAGVSLVSGATSQWTKTEWDERGEIATIPQGEVVFVYRRSTSNSSKMQHTGVAIGDGTCVHARGTAYGVVRQKMSEYSWTHWARPKWSAAKSTSTRKTLRRGDIGQDVTALQLALLAAGYSLRVYGADGEFGTETENAVKAFQQANGLTVDGIAGAKTWTALDGAPAAPLYTVTVNGLQKAQAEEIQTQYGGTMTAEEG